MTEAERIEKKELRTLAKAMDYLNQKGYADQAMFNLKEHPRKLSELLEDFSYQENERLQQLIKEKEPTMELVYLRDRHKKLLQELKSAQELNLELMEGIKKAFRKGTWLSMYEELESLINKAK